MDTLSLGVAKSSGLESNISHTPVLRLVKMDPVRAEEFPISLTRAFGGLSN